MKKLLIVLLISLVCYSNQRLPQQIQVSKFDNDQEAQESVEYTMCLKLITYPEFLEYVRQLIEEGEYPKGSDLEETALSVCLTVSQSSTPFKTTSTNYVPQARAGQLVLYVPIKNTLEPSPYLPKEDELILKKRDKEQVKGILRAIKKFIDTVIDAAIELIDAIF